MIDLSIFDSMYSPLSERPEAIAAACPVYTDAGDCVRVYYPDGAEEDLAVTLTTWLRRMTKRQATSPRLLRGVFQKRALYRPLVLPPTVLVPLKVRRPKCPRDATIGYINVLCVKQVESGADAHEASVLLHGGARLTVYWQPATVRRHLEEALAFLPQPAAHPLYPVALRLAEALQILCRPQEKAEPPHFPH